MKHFFCVFNILLLSCVSFSGVAQNLTLDASTDLTPPPTSNYFARDYVRLQPGSEAHPAQGQYVHVYTDKSLQFDANYDNAGVNYSDDQVNSSIDYSLQVGKIEGFGSVTPTGQATYDIPIALPPGTKGVVPTLGITYNSGAFDGVLGRGWNIRGLSSISRVPKDAYHDGIIYSTYYRQGLKFDNSLDAFALDGNRIIGVVTDVNGARLENDNFSQIKLSGSSFVVSTKDGLVMEYGSTSDSKLELSAGNFTNPTLVWYLSKIVDQYGNYISYVYGNQDNEIIIKEINYTGTTSETPYNSIKFYYDQRSDKSTVYIAGNELNSKLLLREINVFCENNFTKGYLIKYGVNCQSFLNEITMIGSDYSKLNSTYFKYGDEEVLPQPPSIIEIADMTCTGQMCNSLVCTQQSTPYTFTQQTTVHFELTYNTNAGGCSTSVAVAVISKNGSQLTNFHETSTGYDYTFVTGDLLEMSISAQYKCSYRIVATVIQAEGNMISTSYPVVVPSAAIIRDAEYRVGDFNGDGKSDFVAFKYTINSTTGSKDYTGDWSLYLNIDGTGTNFSEYTLSSSLLPSPFFPYPYHEFFAEFDPRQIGFQVADFDLDGMADILIGSSDQSGTIYKVFYSTGTNFSDRGYPMSVDNQSEFVLADLDGDHISEGVEYSEGVSSTNCIRRFKVFWFNTGQETLIKHNGNTNQFVNQNNALVNVNTNYTGFTAIDFDGDGIHELFTRSSSEAVVLKINLDLSDAALNKSKEVSRESIYPNGTSQNYLGDFNGDGITDNIKLPASTSATISYGNGTSFTSPATTSIYGVTGLKKYIVCDINQDGKDDLLKMESAGTSVLCSAFLGGQLNSGPVNYGFINESFPLDYVQQNYPNDVPEFLTGDFDGDGKPDVFFKTSGAGERAIAFICKGSTRHLLTKISDGFRNKTEFSYATLANGGSDVYIKSGGAVPAHVINCQPPFYVVREFTIPDGVSGTNTTTFFYEGAKIHLQGKGFLGFDKFTATNNINNIKVESVYSNPDPTTYYERLPLSTKTFLLPDVTNPITEEIYTSVPVSTSGLAHFIKTTLVESVNHITASTVTKIMSYDDVNGNLTFTSNEVPIIGGTEKTETTTVYEHAGTYGSILNVPASVITTVTRTPGGGGAYSRSTTYHHNTSTGALEFTINDPGPDNAIKTTLTYFTTGVCDSKKVEPTGSNCEDCPTKNYSYEYDNYFRFITKEHNPLNQITELRYDARWGMPVWKKDVDGLITQYFYDGYGRCINTITPDNLSTEVISDWVQPGDMPSVDHLGINTWGLYSLTSIRLGSPVIKTYFDQFGRELETETNGFSGTKIFKQKMYDETGNTQKETNTYIASDGLDYLTTTYTYDDADGPNLLKIISTTDNNGNTKTTNLSYGFGFGNTIITTTPPDGHATSKTTDASGKLIIATDNGGAITYDYFSNGQLQAIKVNNVIANSMTYDNFWHKLTLTDKDAGAIIYNYNAYGQLRTQEDARGNKYTMVYDELGKLKQKTGSDGTVYSYAYVQNGNNGINQLQQQSVTHTNGGTYSSTIAYDGLCRRSSLTENVNGEFFITSYQYDNYSRISKTINPGGFATINEYDANGYITDIKDGGNTSIWQGTSVNSLGQYDQYIKGNIVTQLTYSNFGALKEINAGNDVVQHLKMDFDLNSGNLNWREDLTGTRNLHEAIGYDNQNRFTHSQIGTVSLNINYNAAGTIENKDDAGDYSDYATAHPDAVEKLTSVSNPGISYSTQDISYTPFNKVKSITEDGNILSIEYGCDEQRRKTEMTGNASYVKYFIGNYEKLTVNGHTYEINYVKAPTGLCAMYVTDNGIGTMYYVYSDYLGSILKVTDGTNDYEQSFDAWGRYRHADTWDILNTTPSLPEWLSRGYTGHEHLPGFALINMNGRFYDPILGMMLSPDNYVPDATSTQGYNRYNYVFNNPLSFIDPDGNYMYFPHSHGTYDYVGGLSGSGGSGPPHGAGVGLGGVPTPGYYNQQGHNWSVDHGFIPGEGPGSPVYNGSTGTYAYNGQNVPFSFVMRWEFEHGNLTDITSEYFQNPVQTIDLLFTISANSWTSSLPRNQTNYFVVPVHIVSGDRLHFEPTNGPVKIIIKVGNGFEEKEIDNLYPGTNNGLPNGLNRILNYDPFQNRARAREIDNNGGDINVYIYNISDPDINITNRSSFQMWIDNPNNTPSPQMRSYMHDINVSPRIGEWPY